MMEIVFKKKRIRRYVLVVTILFLGFVCTKMNLQKGSASIAKPNESIEIYENVEQQENVPMTKSDDVKKVDIGKSTDKIRGNSTVNEQPTERVQKSSKGTEKTNHGYGERLEHNNMNLQMFMTQEKMQFPLSYPLFADYVLVIEENPMSADYDNESVHIRKLAVKVHMDKEVGKSPIATMTYQWYVNAIDSNCNGRKIEGAAQMTFRPFIKEEGIQYYYCVVTSTYGNNTISIPSKTARVSVQYKKYKVIFETNSDISVPTQDVKYLETAEKPETPVREGYRFTGWYRDNARRNIYAFQTPVTQKTTLYAGWELAPNTSVSASNPTKTKDDESSSGTEGDNDKGESTSTGDNEEKPVSTKIDLTNLQSEIEIAQRLYDSIPTEEAILDIGDSYIDETSKNKLGNTIKSINEHIAGVGTQADADRLFQKLKKAETTFTDNIKKVTWNFIRVDGSILTACARPNCTITRIQYNQENSGGLAQGIWNNWSGFASLKYKTKYSKYCWENIENGVYTFIIYQQNAKGEIKFYFETVVVANGNTQEDVIEEYVRKQLGLAKALLESTPSEADVTPGALCVPIAMYNKLSAMIVEMEQVLSSESPTYHNMIAASLNLSNAVRAFQGSVQLSKDYPEAVITVEKGKITVSRGNLYKFSIAKGDYKNWNEFKDSAYQTQVVTGGTISVQVEENAVYTLRLYYNDESCEYRQVKVTELEELEQKAEELEELT